MTTGSTPATGPASTANPTASPHPSPRETRMFLVVGVVVCHAQWTPWTEDGEVLHGWVQGMCVCSRLPSLSQSNETDMVGCDNDNVCCTTVLRTSICSATSARGST
jgi:hypothetical protein